MLYMLIGLNHEFYSGETRHLIVVNGGRPCHVCRTWAGSSCFHCCWIQPFLHHQFLMSDYWSLVGDQALLFSPLHPEKLLEQAFHPNCEQWEQLQFRNQSEPESQIFFFEQKFKLYGQHLCTKSQIPRQW